MIIKVKGTGNTESWRFYDGASEVQSHVGLRSKFNSDDTPDEVTVEWFERGIVPVDDPVDKQMVLVAFRDKDNNPRHIIADTTIYLMNDDGKTIERLN
jgi:hypothetical protein